MGNSLLKDGQPNDIERRTLQGLWPVFEKAFTNPSAPKWDKFQISVEAAEGLKRLLDASEDECAESSSDKHEKFLRVILHVMAGMFVASTVLLAAIIGGFGSGLSSTRKAEAALYTQVFSDLMMWLALLLLVGAIASLIIQGLRLSNKLDLLSERTCSIIAVVVVIVTVFIPSYLATETAVCGAAALAMKNPPQIDSQGTAPKIAGSEIAESAPFLRVVPVSCTSETHKWFPLPKN